MVTELVIKLFSFFKLSFMAGLRGTFIVINGWVEILTAFIIFNISIFWRFVIWTFSLVTLPARAVAALYREKQVQAQLSELQVRLDDLVLDRKELREHIRMAIKEHEMMEVMLGELEDEHDEAIRKIKLLETELQDLKDENLRLKEVHGKSQWDTGTLAGASYNYNKNHNNAKLSNPKDRISQWKKSDHYNVTNIPMQDLVKNYGASLMHQIIPNVNWDDIIGQRREVALSQTLFSAMLSLLVGMIIWEAEDPCMPLVTALFMVVGMSLKSVVHFFSTINNKPASDAVALLSLNSFILGTLMYPTLPRVARFSAPFLFKSLDRVLGGFGFDFKFD